ncbi:MAG TPA: response regulator [Pedobacter sp.]|jgi:CheY-like chemotaxis protein
MCKSIFIIDDYPINLKLAEIIVKRHSSFDIVSSYEEAQQALDQIAGNLKDIDSLPDIILLDLNMPVMDGWQFLEQFEVLRPLLSKNVDIFILSSSMDIRDKQRSEQYLSVKGFFSKPLTPGMLLTMTNSLASAS